jgi:hypothetical protein
LGVIAAEIGPEVLVASAARAGDRWKLEEDGAVHQVAPARVVVDPVKENLAEDRKIIDNVDAAGEFPPPDDRPDMGLALARRSIVAL